MSKSTMRDKDVDLDDGRAWDDRGTLLQEEVRGAAEETEFSERLGRTLQRKEKQDQDDDGVSRADKMTAKQPPLPITDPFPTLEIAASTSAAPRPERSRPVASGDAYARSSDRTSSSSGSNSVNDHPSSTVTVSHVPEKATSGRSVDSITVSKPRTLSISKPATKKPSHESVRKLSASQMQALTSSPDSLPVAAAPLSLAPPPLPPPHQRKANGTEYPKSAGIAESASRLPVGQLQNSLHASAENESLAVPSTPVCNSPKTAADLRRPPAPSRTLSTPPINRRATMSSHTTSPNAARRNSFNPLPRPSPLNLSHVGPKISMSSHKPDRVDQLPPSPILPAIPLAPMSIHTHLNLELAGQRPSPLYIHHSHAADMPYESSAVKFERLFNAISLPWYLEQILTFGTLACLDAWLYTITILPMRFLIAAGVLGKWWAYVVGKEVRWVVGYVWQGIWRLWQRAKRGRPPHDQSSQAASEAERSQSRARGSSSNTQQNGTLRHRTASEPGGLTSLETSRLNGNGVFHPPKHPLPRTGGSRHRRTKSIPSNLTPYHKADLLQGAILLCSVIALMGVDASRMYHFIRAQSSMKLYVIFNILEVADRLLSALGQDILECLFSSETLSRNSSGRSKVLLPLGMFILSLIYNVLHTWCLFYQAITLNVAVNSYSNSLLTLLISNQFVEIKGSVFKRIEKENLFQLTCSDVVERFQLWVILSIIGMRNVVEVGGFSVPGAGSELDGNVTKPGPVHTSSILPASFTVLPSWLLSGEVLSPFLVVIGIEMMVDWIKHAYINKFNNIKPTIYKRMLDVLAKDYYTNAFSAPSLTRRLGLPLLPLSCLFVRAMMQVYHMFLSTHLHPPLPTSTTELLVESSTPSSPAMIAAFEHLDTLIRNALGRAVYGYPYNSPDPPSFWAFSSDDVIAVSMTAIFFMSLWFVFLIAKLLLGMLLLRYSRERYVAMKRKEHSVAAGKAEHENFSQPGKRIGSWGAVEIGDDRRRWLYEDDQDGLKKMRERERKTEEKFKEKGDDGLSKVVRYEMIAKRIW
ncbi:DUF747-domain-containing protein [Durotheca rogersii]|uniref:DUF747-domain-containing protein n=1 Tax=Durotheca rogersii TaxID=419775 RepID=UPI00221F3310|nr:DUF747-domain-containing protein [Durotheca rogersii]KAI5859264.1 DUF747-domain-containing protein [Durotheca rogersii]